MIQFCPVCFPPAGGWVHVETHPHPLPPVRAHVWSDEPGSWVGALQAWTGNEWVGAARFPSWPEALTHALELVGNQPALAEEVCS